MKNIFPEFVKYYYKTLNKVEQQIYLQLYKGLRMHQSEIKVTLNKDSLPIDRFMHIFRCLYNDTPSFYFVNPSKIQYVETSSVYIVTFNFLYTKKEIERFNSLILSRLRSFKQKYIHQKMSDYEKELIIHDFLISTVEYDWQINQKDYDLEHPEIYSVLGPLLRKKAVCLGIACAFKLMCDYIKVKCLVVTGDTRPIIPSQVGHAWNIVNLDGFNYHVDATWDLKARNGLNYSYDYFNLNDNLMRIDHVWERVNSPSCDSLKHNYHKLNRLYVKNVEQIPNFIRKKVYEGQNFITFKFVNHLPSDENVLQKIKEGILLAGIKDCSFIYSINTDTHNIYIEIPKK